uniref:Uncharacterized protein n=1 Tax=Glossina pallidipes TaxID=7398 RepID=A0A1A9ZBD2_GLOPL
MIECTPCSVARGPSPAGPVSKQILISAAATSSEVKYNGAVAVDQMSFDLDGLSSPNPTLANKSQDQSDKLAIPKDKWLERLSSAPRVSYAHTIKRTLNMAPVECDRSAATSSNASHNYAIDLSRKTNANSQVNCSTMPFALTLCKKISEHYNLAVFCDALVLGYGLRFGGWLPGGIFSISNLTNIANRFWLLGS